MNQSTDSLQPAPASSTVPAEGRVEHLAWCKQRALEYVEAGDLQNAMGSMTSDLSKHPDTRDHPAILLGMQLMMGGFLSTQAEMRKWIEGYN